MVGGGGRAVGEVGGGVRSAECRVNGRLTTGGGAAGEAEFTAFGGRTPGAAYIGPPARPPDRQVSIRIKYWPG